MKPDAVGGEAPPSRRSGASGPARMRCCSGTPIAWATPMEPHPPGDLSGGQQLRFQAWRTWRPRSVRQRLLIEGFYTIDVDPPVIERYFETFTASTGLRSYGAPTTFAPRRERRDENQGYDAFVPLIDSGISLYIWSGLQFLSVVAFSCKRFDSRRAVEVTSDFFQMTRAVHDEF